MATNNFYYKNTDFIFGVEDKNYYKKLNKAIEKFRKLGYEIKDEIVYDLRDYPSRIIAEKRIYLDDEKYFYYQIKIMLTAGYYGDACFDYDYDLFCCDDLMDHINLDKDEIMECFIGEYSVKEALEYGIITKSGLEKIKNVAKQVLKECKSQRILHKEKKTILKIFKNLADYILYQKGSFSNGEGWYIPLNKSQIEIKK